MGIRLSSLFKRLLVTSDILVAVKLLKCMIVKGGLLGRGNSKGERREKGQDKCVLNMIEVYYVYV
jgi:hypothetical protein